MCEDHGNQPQVEDDAHIAVVEDQFDGISRRQLLQGAGLLVGAGLVSRSAWPTPAFGAVPSFDGLSARSMAMHVHSSFSEGGGSMDSQLYQAAINNVDVVWWTDHDWKMRARAFKSRVHFTSLTSEQTDGKPWTWSQQRSGPLSARSGGGLASQGSPGDPVPSGSLQVTAESTSTSMAQVGYLAGTAPAHTLRVNVFGQRWTLDVLPESIGTNAYMEMRVSLSHHPAQNGRPAGNYVLSYRVGGQGVPGSAVAQGLTGVISLPATTGTWTTYVLSLSDDIAAIWPDMNPRDFATVNLSFYAVSTGGLAQGRFDYLRMERPFTTGDVPLDTQDNIGTELSARYPTVAQRQGLEVSWGLPHVNWFGGAVTIPEFVSGQGVSWTEFLRATVEDIHLAGGLVSYNHPFGASNPSTALSQSSQDAELRRLAAVLLANQHLGCDILEVGYPQRAGYDLAHHVGLWDVLSRNGRFVTGNGVNDDHGSNRWRRILNNWVTRVWSVSDSEPDLLAALGAGRAWATQIGVPMSLDLIADGRCPMGSVSVSSLSQREVRVMASDLPLGASVQVLRGEVDYAGSDQPVPNTSVVATFQASELSSGSAVLAVDTTSSCFVRLSVRGSDGTMLGFSNPLWMLREAPAGGIPVPRDYEVAWAA